MYTKFILVIIDSVPGGGCQTATFNIGTTAAGIMAPNRNWDIRVTQYGCGSQDISGPPGCLQYYTGEMGQISRYFRFCANTSGPGNWEVSKLGGFETGS